HQRGRALRRQHGCLRDGRHAPPRALRRAPATWWNARSLRGGGRGRQRAAARSRPPRGGCYRPAMLRRDLAALASREHDVVVVGGGIHGAAAAWEAASRNLSVALLEAHDFGAGASWNSLKTIHGGLRHLQRLDVAGLRESARERRALLAIAPDLV